jgi:hypothetical protein
MATKITRDIIESWLNCKYKAYLKLTGESGTPSDYEAMTKAAGQLSREEAIAKLVARYGEGDACRDMAVTAATLKQGKMLLADAELRDEGLSLRFDALKRADGSSKVGDHHYLPVLQHWAGKVRRQQKVLLALHGLALARVQGLRPAVGLIARGPKANGPGGSDYGADPIPFFDRTRPGFFCAPLVTATPGQGEKVEDEGRAGGSVQATATPEPRRRPFRGSSRSCRRR